MRGVLQRPPLFFCATFAKIIKKEEEGRLLKRHARLLGRKGFTLVEVIVVLVILAILAAIVVPAMTGWIDNAKEKVCAVNRSQLERLAYAAVVAEYEEGLDSRLAAAVGDSAAIESLLWGTGLVEGDDCPSGGDYTYRYDTATRRTAVRCSIHGGGETGGETGGGETGGEGGDTPAPSPTQTINDFVAKVDAYTGKANQLDKYLNAQYPSGRPTVTVEGQDVYLKADKTATGRIIFAASNANSAQIEYLYNTDTGVWYKFYLNGKTPNTSQISQYVTSDGKPRPEFWVAIS